MLKRGHLVFPEERRLESTYERSLSAMLRLGIECGVSRIDLKRMVADILDEADGNKRA